MGKFYIEKKIPWGHRESHAMVEVTAYVSGAGNPGKSSNGDNPFVPFPVPRPFPKPQDHKATLKPLALEEEGEIWFDTDVSYTLYESARKVFNMGPDTPLPKYKGELHVRHVFKYHFKDSGDDTVIDGGDLIIEKPVREDRGNPPHPQVIQLRFENDKGDGKDPGKKGPYFVRVMPTVVVQTSTTTHRHHFPRNALSSSSYFIQMTTARSSSRGLNTSLSFRSTSTFHWAFSSP